MWAKAGLWAQPAGIAAKTKRKFRQTTDSNHPHPVAENVLDREFVPEGQSTDPLLALASYLASHPDHLDYAGRLARGQSIGSGQVEGAIKELVNLRRKRTGARWRCEHVGPLVELIDPTTSSTSWHYECASMSDRWSS